jgi:hypothetical protein
VIAKGRGEVVLNKTTAKKPCASNTIFYGSNNISILTTIFTYTSVVVPLLNSVLFIGKMAKFFCDFPSHG